MGGGSWYKSAETARQRWQKREVQVVPLGEARLKGRGGAGAGNAGEQGVTVDAGDCLVDREGTIGCLPVLAIAGVQRAGTTVLQMRLTGGGGADTVRQRRLRGARSPFGKSGGEDSGCWQSWGETHFLDHLHELDGARGPSGTFAVPRQWKQYAARFRPAWADVQRGQLPFFIDKSPNYTLLDHHGAWFASQIVPSLKTVVILRDPVSRTYSSYQHQCYRGRISEQRRTEPGSSDPSIGFCSEKHSMWDAACEHGRPLQFPCTPGSFARILRERGSLDDSWVSKQQELLEHPERDPAQFMGRSYFLPQLVNWATHFPDNQTLVVFNEDLVLDTYGALKIVSEFAGMPTPPKHEFSITSLVATATKGFYYPRMLADTRNKLVEHLCSHNQLLQRLLNVEFPANWPCVNGKDHRLQRDRRTLLGNELPREGTGDDDDGGMTVVVDGQSREHGELPDANEQQDSGGGESSPSSSSASSSSSSSSSSSAAATTSTSSGGIAHTVGRHTAYRWTVTPARVTKEYRELVDDLWDAGGTRRLTRPPTPRRNDDADDPTILVARLVPTEELRTTQEEWDIWIDDMLANPTFATSLLTAIGLCVFCAMPAFACWACRALGRYCWKSTGMSVHHEKQ